MTIPIDSKEEAITKASFKVKSLLDKDMLITMISPHFNKITIKWYDGETSWYAEYKHTENI